MHQGSYKQYSSPTASHVNVKVSQDAVQVRVPVVAVTAVIENQASFEFVREQIVHLGLSDPLRNHHLRNLSRSKLHVAQSPGEQAHRIEGALLNQGLVTEQSGIVRIHVGPHSPPPPGIG